MPNKLCDCGTMRILLVQPQLNYGHQMPEAPSQALLILGTLAENKGHEVKIVHNGSFPKEFKPDIVGITVNTFQVKHAKEIVKQARECGAKVVIGGPHAPAWDLPYEPDCYAVIGQGENTWLEILGEGVSPLQINDLPLPNYDLIDFDKFCGIGPVGAIPTAAIMASRGCPYQCTFCNTPIFWGRKIRYRKPELVLDEVQHLHEKYGINEVFFQDDTFNVNHKWASEIFQGLIDRGLSDEMLFKIACRVNLITKEFLDLAYKAGVWNIFYGIESGSQEMLDRMKKGITIKDIKSAIEMTHEAGIDSQCSFIVGMPGETLRTLAQTDALINEIKPTRYGWVYFCPFPNTEARKEAETLGHLKDVPYEEYGYGKVLARTDALTFEELQSFKGFSYE